MARAIGALASVKRESPPISVGSKGLHIRQLGSDDGDDTKAVVQQQCLRRRYGVVPQRCRLLASFAWEVRHG